MILKFLQLLVQNQDKALEFYTRELGFEKMADIPMGDSRWLTLTSPDGLSGVELVLESTSFKPALVYQQALFDAGIPQIAIISSDIDVDYQRLINNGVIFRSEPRDFEVIKSALFEDTCGNLVNLVQPKENPDP